MDVEAATPSRPVKKRRVDDKNVRDAGRTPLDRHTVSPAPSSVPAFACLSGFDCYEHPKLSEISMALGVQLTEQKHDLIFCEIAKKKKKGRVVNVKDKRGHVQSYLNVPVTSNEYYFQQNHSAVDSFININGLNDSDHNAAVRLTKDLAVHYTEPVLEALRAVGTPLTEYMNETKIVAMFEDANITLLQERKIVQHLRHQVGTKTFATRKRYPNAV